MGGVTLLKKLRGKKKRKGKDGDERVKNDQEISGQKGPKQNKPITKEEAKEFLRVVKHSEYSIVDQLKKTPAKISLFSLFMSSEPHRNTLMKVLNEQYVMPYTSPDKV